MRKNITVSEIMSKSPIVIGLNTPIETIHNIFEEHPFHHIPVLDHGIVKGIVSKVDYLKVRHMLAFTWSGACELNDMYNYIRAEDIMSSPALMIDASDTIGLAADIFLSNTMHALPVVEDGELVGIVTSHDLLSYAYEEI